MKVVACALVALTAAVQFAEGAVERLETGWEFRRGEAPWSAVSVPHDWAISGDFDRTNDLQFTAIWQDGQRRKKDHTGRTGALPHVGRGFYRRTIELPEGVRSAALVFEGAMSEAEVYTDGVRIGGWKNGYNTFKVDLPRKRSQLVEVRLEVRPMSSRWYPGAGLIRPVYLVTNEADAEAAVLARPAMRAKLPKIEVNDRGFFVNGKKTEFKGVCLHHDLGPLGAAWNADAFRRQVRIMKSMGANAIRTAHNFPCPEQLDICDEEDMMVMAESFDEWRLAKVENGYHLHFDEWWKRDLEQLVKICRDHPCVVMYSIGNEVNEQSDAKGIELCRAMQAYLKKLDPSRPITQGLDRAHDAIKHGFVSEMEIAGLNYRLQFYDEAHGHARNGIVLGTETASAVSSRGVYKFPVAETKGATYADGQCSSYDLGCCGWSNLPDDDWAMQEDREWTIGEFVWTGFDYLGEPTPYYEYWPSRSAYFGAVDLAGLPKDRYYLYRSHWNRSEPTLHLLPHWTWPGREGQVTPVYVYTSYPEAELFVNGRSQGRRRFDRSSRLDRFRLRWNEVVYEPGEVKVVAYDRNGAAVAEKVVRTAGPFARFVEMAEDYGRLRFVTVTAVDERGERCPDYDGVYRVKVPDGWSFRAICNGDATSLESFVRPVMRLFHGQLVYVLSRAK